MLVVSRKVNQSVVIGNGDMGIAQLMVVEIRGDKVRLGFQAHPAVPVHRFEVHRAVQREMALRGEKSFAQVVSYVPEPTPAPTLTLQFPSYQLLSAALSSGVVQFEPLNSVEGAQYDAA
ncbi:hypothetical protein Q31a_17590 [Aureliella helgolandensis]|uniref:Translational regulator CsrA n=1 Tax=Aureliella helgolandensis TaxID=2527968 RepID=A0A518G4D8_9BACT|nr:hypothetical protein Q31a_17590 [Aureliella helgolandensis]